MIEHAFIFPGLIGLLIMINMSLFALIRIERSRHRQAELERVKILLPRHYDALDRIQAADALPLEMKEAAAWISSAIENQDAALFFVEQLNVADAGQREENVEIKALRSTHPELMDDYDLAMNAGILAFLLKWPGTARRAVGIMDDLVTSRHEEAAVAFRVVHERSPGRSSLVGAF